MAAPTGYKLIQQDPALAPWIRTPCNPGASSMFQLDAFFIRAATGPPRLGEGEPLIRWGKVPLFHDEGLAYYSK